MATATAAAASSSLEVAVPMLAALFWAAAWAACMARSKAGRASPAEVRYRRAMKARG